MVLQKMFHRVVSKMNIEIISTVISNTKPDALMDRISIQD